MPEVFDLLTVDREERGRPVCCLLTQGGAVAQLGERVPRTDEARSSNLLCSTI